MVQALWCSGTRGALISAPGSGRLVIYETRQAVSGLRAYSHKPRLLGEETEEDCKYANKTSEASLENTDCTAQSMFMTKGAIYFCGMVTGVDIMMRVR